MFQVRNTTGKTFADGLDEIDALVLARLISKEQNTFAIVIKEGAARHCAIYRNGAYWG